jgi:hypothetical protein
VAKNRDLDLDAIALDIKVKRSIETTIIIVGILFMLGIIWLLGHSANEKAIPIKRSNRLITVSGRRSLCGV